MIDRELDGTLEHNAEHLVQEIDNALVRIETGSYGLCVTCAQRIPEERLDAVPYATLCVGCKREEERRERAGL
jgi:DnaK suppressor protein